MRSLADSVLALDLGGTNLRAALVGPDGSVRHMWKEAHRPGAEVDPERWWLGLHEGASAIARTAGPAFAAVQAVCITGVTRTQVVVDGGGNALRPALSFADSRAAAMLADLPGLPHPEAAHLNPYHPAARLLWLARHEPEVLAQARAVIDPKDYLAARLTGRVCSDPISAARLVAAAAAPSLLSMLGLPAHLVPELVEPGRVIGSVQGGLDGAWARLRGIPVVMTAHDTWGCVLGMGALADGAAYNLSGTTEVLGLLSRNRASAEGLLGVEWGDGLHHLGGPSNAGGAAVAWVAGLLAPGEAAGPALDRLPGRQRHAQPALFLPYLEGERTPHWDPLLRGAFLGLHPGHEQPDLLWAALEGVACLNRLVLERAEAAAGRAAEIRFGGGGAASAVWAQVKADMLDRPVVTTREAEAGLLGAGITAWTALGLARSLRDGQESMVHVARTFEPGPARREFYDQLYAAFCAADPAVASVSRMLATIG